MRIGLLLLWAVLLAAGAWKISRRPAAKSANSHPTGDCLANGEKKALPHWTAARSMPLNWLLHREDLADAKQPNAPSASKFVGQYLRCKVAAGDNLVDSDLMHLAELPVVEGKVLHPQPVSQPDADALNTGSHVSLFDGPVEVVSMAEVAAVDCRGSCVAWLQVTPSEKLLLDGKTTFRLIPRAAKDQKDK